MINNKTFKALLDTENKKKIQWEPRLWVSRLEKPTSGFISKKLFRYLTIYFMNSVPLRYLKYNLS